MSHKAVITDTDSSLPLELLEKVRTQKNAWNRAVNLSVEKAAGQKIETMSIRGCGRSPGSSSV
jgi:hypothetical protein